MTGLTTNITPIKQDGSMKQNSITESVAIQKNSKYDRLSTIVVKDKPNQLDGQSEIVGDIRGSQIEQNNQYMKNMLPAI